MTKLTVNPKTSNETPMTWVVAMIFWLQLLLAALLYGAVALAPKLMIYNDLHDKSIRTQARLVHLEGQVNELRKVVDSLENDPLVMHELARVDLDAVRPGEERIALTSDLVLQSRLTAPFLLDAEVTRAWYVPFLNAFAANRKLRVTCLAVAAMLVLVAFTFFHTAQVKCFSLGWGNFMAGPRELLSRYRGSNSRRS